MNIFDRVKAKRELESMTPKRGLVDDLGIFSDTGQPSKSVTALAPYMATSAVRGIMAPVLPALKAIGIDTQKLLDDAVNYWGEKSVDLGSIPNYGIAPKEPGSLVPTIERLPDMPVKEGILGPTAEGAGFVAVPGSAAMKAGQAVASKIPARAPFQRIAGGMTGGSLLGEGDPEKTLESAGMFGAFSVPGVSANTLKSIPVRLMALGTKTQTAIKNRILQSRVWKNLTPAQRVPVIQDFEAFLGGMKKIHPELSEVEIYKKFAKGNYMDEALERFVKGESNSIFDEIYEKKDPWIGESANVLEPEVKDTGPSALGLSEQAGPSTPNWAEGTGEIRHPYPGLGEPLIRREAGNIPPMIPPQMEAQLQPGEQPYPQALTPEQLAIINHIKQVDPRELSEEDARLGEPLTEPIVRERNAPLPAARPIPLNIQPQPTLAQEAGMPQPGQPAPSLPKSSGVSALEFMRRAKEGQARPPIPIPGLQHLMPTGEVMPGPEHAGAVPGSTQVIPKAIPRKRRQ